MAARIKLVMDPEQKILLKRHLGKNGKGQEVFTQTVALFANPYVPFLTGNLKDGQVKVGKKKITYSAPYAHRQYYGNKGMGNEGMAFGGLRGPQWINRMWADRGDQVIEVVADYCGGKR